MSDIPIDVQELFPELQGLLNQWDTPAGPLANGEGFENENGIEPTDIEQAMQARWQQQQPPRFAPGQTAPPPPASHVEDGGPNGNGAQTIPAAAPPAAPAVQPEGAVQPPPAAAPPADEEIELGQDDQGQPIRVPRSRLLNYLQFDRDFQDDPGLRQAVLDYYASRGVGQTEQQPPAGPVAPSPTFPQQPPEPEIDLDDPNVRYLVDQQRQLQEQIQMLTGAVQTTYQQQQNRAQAENESLIKRATKSFKESRNLDDRQMKEIRESAARLNVVPALLEGVDPITGAPSKPDPLTALDRAFEIAYMMNPEYRQREFGREIQRRVTDAQRKQKLAGISGSSGSVPRTQQAPTTAEGRRQGLVDEVRQMFDGQWAPPES